MGILTHLADMWSATDFEDDALCAYAEERLRAETRFGVQTVAAFALAMQLCIGLVATAQGLPANYTYTSLLFGLLALHILISARFVDDVQALQALGITFLVIGAMAVTFVAHRAGDLNIGMMATIVMLIVAIPLVPWALREATTVIGLTYLLLTASFALVPERFETHSLLVLLMLVLGAAAVVVVVTARNTFIRRNDIRARYELEKAHREIKRVSMRDPLTGAWNRRFISERFGDIAESRRAMKQPLQLAVMDIDDFKGINDRFGHHTGDVVLTLVAKTFMRRIGDHGYVVRMGGDEFQVIYFGDDLGQLIDDAVCELRSGQMPPEVSAECRVSLSAGIVRADDYRPGSLEQLYKAADRALYQAKRARPSPDADADVVVQTGTWQL